MKSKISTAAVLALALSMCMGSAAYAGNSKYFIDVNDGSYGWSSDAVDYLCLKGIAKGTGDNKYSPGFPIERGDFVVLLNNSFDLGEFSGYKYGFSDVPDDSYYHTAIVNAKGSGVITDNFSFYPELPIMRGDAMGMLYRALDLNGYIKNATTDISMYSDADSIRDINGQMAVGTLTQMGIISGNGGKILYTDHMTRAEMAMIFYKTLSYMEENPVEKRKTGSESERAVTTANGKKVSAAEASEKANEEVIENPNADIVSGLSSKSGVVIDGETVKGIEGCDIKLQSASKNGVEVARKVNGTIANSTIHAKSANANAVYVNGKGSVNITDSNLYNSGSGSTVLKGAQGSEITASNCDINTNTKGSYVVKTGGKVTIDNSKIYISDANGIASEDNGEINIKGCDITANGVSNGLFVGTKGSNPDDGNTSEINVRNSNISGDRKTALFYSDKNNVKATLTNCSLDRIAYLVNSRASAVQTENVIEITLNAQQIEADVIAEEYTRVIINLTNGSVLKGSINEQNTAKYVEVNVESGSQLELTTNSYIDVLKYNDVIDIYENGYTIYYDKDNSKNDWLFNDDYQLANGGVLSPE